jgi:DNA-binding beta-propeller fold protein YncE
MRTKITLLFISILLLAIILGGGIWYWQQKAKLPSEEELVVKPKGSKAKIEVIDRKAQIKEIGEIPTLKEGKIPIVIFSQEIKTAVEADGRSWPTVRIFQKIGNSKPEILAEVGKIGEYPRSYALSPDKKFLLINLEKKLQILDLESKELKDLFVPKQEITDILYSPDGKQIFIWDQGLENESFYVHIFTISTGKDEIIKEGVIENFYYSLNHYPLKWREDGKILIGSPGEFNVIIAGYVDLTTSQIVETPENYAIYPWTVFSKTGKLMNVHEGWISNICETFNGEVPNKYNIVDTVSGRVFGTIEMRDQAVEIIAFSPDDKEILISTYKPWTKEEDCQKEPIRNYYKAEISSGRLTKIDNPLEVLAKWNVDCVDAKVNKEPPNRNFILYVGGKPIIESNTELRIIAEYWK